MKESEAIKVVWEAEAIRNFHENGSQSKIIENEFRIHLLIPNYFFSSLSLFRINLHRIVLWDGHQKLFSFQPVFHHFQKGIKTLEIIVFRLIEI